MDNSQVQATGRRKRAIARVKLVLGQGVITVNKKPIEEYFPRPQLQQIVRQPFEATQTGGRYDVIVKAQGGGVTGQAGAVRHGIARALVEMDPCVQRRDAQERFPHARSARKRIEEVRPQARPQTLPVQQTLNRNFGFRLAVIALGIAALLWRPSSLWVEHVYVNGTYPHWEHALHALSAPLPWSLGDIVAILGIIWFVSRLVRRDWLGALAVLATYAIWFEAGWGWCYDRAPIEARTAYDARRITPQAVEALRARVIAQINRLAPLAHAQASEPLDYATLAAGWVPVVQRAGDAWIPAVGAPKPTLSDAFMNATGTSGYINPLALDVHLASDLLWFERPFDLSHEWSHVAGYAREDEANFLAIVNCTRSNNPVVAYSGWLELLLYLPPQAALRPDRLRPARMARFRGDA